MPSASLKKMAEKAGVSMAQAEHDWDRAKEIVKDEYGFGKEDKRFWPLVVGIVKKMLRIKKESFREYLDSLVIEGE